MVRQVLQIGWRINTVALGVLGVWLGVTFLLADPDDYVSPGFRAAIDLMPLHWHGVIFLIMGALILAGYARQKLLVAPLIATSACFAFWAVLFFESWLNNHHAPLSGVPLYLYASVSAGASAMTASAERYG